jgi:hypothetical protein
MKKRLGEQGSATAIIYLLIFIALVYTGIQFGTPFYHYHAFRSQAEGYLKIDTIDPKIVRSKIIGVAKEYNVPLPERNLTVTRDESTNTFSLKANWSETVDLFGYYQKKYDFDLDLQEMR